jgi:tungstate transport system substrate-binding protein
LPFVGVGEGRRRDNRAMQRRPLLAAWLTIAAAPGTLAQVASGPAAPLRLGADRALVESGLARSLQQGFGADTGIAVKLVSGPALAVLDAVRDGEVDAALTNAPEAEAGLDHQGLVHDRRVIAAGEFVVVGPVPRVRGKAPSSGNSGVDALARIQELASSGAEPVLFLSAGDGSGTHVVEQALWRAAHIDPAAPWYATADTKSPFAAQVRSRAAYAVVERGAWLTLGGAPLSIIVEGDPMLAESVHAMRAFRVTHPAGKIFIAWIAGGHGRAIVAAHHGYRVPA